MVEVALNSTLLVQFAHGFFFQAAESWASSKREHLSQAGGAAKRRLRHAETEIQREKKTVLFQVSILILSTIIKQ